MTTLDTHGIASCDESSAFDSSTRSIATEMSTEAATHPEWEKCTDALLNVWRTPSGQEDDQVIAPSRNAIEAAIQCLRHLKATSPSAPPTLIAREPCGGIIIERRSAPGEVNDLIQDFTFYNRGIIEHTIYMNGRIVFMTESSF